MTVPIGTDPPEERHARWLGAAENAGHQPLDARTARFCLAMAEAEISLMAAAWGRDLEQASTGAVQR